MQPSAWAEYLDALERYLRRVAEAVEQGPGVPTPEFSADRCRGALPADEAGRAGRLLGEIESVMLATSQRRDAVLASARVLGERRRLVARPVEHQVRADAVITLPESKEVVAAGRVDELAAAVAAVGLPLPTVYRRPGGGGPFRIVIVVPRTGAGGGARVLFEHANHLRDLGARTVVVSHFAPPAWFELKAGFIEVPFGQPLSASIPPCDLIIAGYWDEILPARLLGIAPVVHFEQGDFHLYDEVPAGLADLVRASLVAADWTITVGQAAQSALADRYGVLARRVANAVDAGVFHPGPRPVGRTALFVGWDGSGFKGIDIARRVADGLALSHPEVASVWITPSPPLGPVIGETVVAPTQHELGRRMREASVYVGTSRYESFPLPPLEAMASGTPVVSTANGGILTYARDGENCLLAPVDDVAALLAATRRVLDHDAVAARLATSGLATAAGFSWPGIVGELLERYRTLSEHLPAPRPLESEVRAAELVFDDERDRSRLFELVDASPYERFAIPVSQPVFGDLHLVRWCAVASKADGFPGTGRAYLPARRDEVVSDSRYQFGIDLLRIGCAEDACSWFIGQCQQSPEDAQSVIGRWVLLALIESGRVTQAVELASTLVTAHPSHPDYYLLSVIAARAAHQTVDLTAAAEAIRVLGNGAHFDEWFDRPGELLRRRLAP